MDWSNWNWSDFCPTGLQPFASNTTNELQPCFQELVLQMPMYTAFAAVSSYHFGKQTFEATRNNTQLRALHARIGVCIVLALLPVCKIFVFHHNGISIFASDVLVVCYECIMWLVHAGYLTSRLRHGSFSHRGSLSILVIWLTVMVLDVVWLISSISTPWWWPWSLATIAFDLIYAVTLIPKGNAILANGSAIHAQQDASQRYTYFRFDFSETHLGHAQDEANLLSRFFFNWVNPLIKKGQAGALKKIEDLFDLPDSLSIFKLSEKLQQKIAQTKTLFTALHKSFGLEFYMIGILRFIADIAGFAGPLLLGGLLSSEGDASSNRAYFYACGLFGTTLLSALCSTHFNWRMAMIGMKMRIGLVSNIYRKALDAKQLKESCPEILNLMSTDTDRIVNSCISFHSFWSIPFQLFTTLYLLYTQLGAAFVAGLLFAVALIPINKWLAGRIGAYSQGLMTAKDARLSATSETMTGARQIKLNAWEDVFIEKILQLRKTELDYLKKRKYLDAMCVYFWATTPVLMCFLTFGVSVLMGNPLVAASTYTSVALLNMLIGPLNAFPWVLNGLIEAWISLKRVQQLLDLPNLDLSSFYHPIIKGESSISVADEKPTVFNLKDVTFQLASISSASTFRLEKVNFEAKMGDLICIDGPIGGGKSTFLSALAANVDCVDGRVCVRDFSSGFGYVPQTPWLQCGTIRANIVWGGVFDEQWYKSVLNACALNDDLQELGGDLINIGENGHTLSGGQRARVALARAVYQDKDVYLLDDVLASVDAHVARHIIKYLILKLLSKKTRIIVTRNPALLFHSNEILHVENGTVTRSSLMSDSIDLSLEEDDDDDENSALRRNSIELDILKQTTQEAKLSDASLLEETREYGRLSKSVFSCYWHAVNTPLALTVLAFVVLMQLSRNVSDAWLAHWVTETTLNGNNTDTSLNHIASAKQWLVGAGAEPGHSVRYYLSIFAALAVSNSIFTMARALLFAYAGVKAAKFLHEKLLNKVMFTKFQFFDITPVGRILNRFSSDAYTIDDSLPFILNILLAQLVGLMGALVISLYAMPWLALVILPIIPVYLNLQYRYRHASRDIKRLSSNALSPLYTHFTESLQGLLTIRTMRASARFQRDFHSKLEESIKAQLTAASAQQWLGLRLQLMGTLLVGGAGFLAALTSAHTSSPGFVGLAISYALSVTGLLGGLLNAIAETEQEFVAVERVAQYLKLEEEQTAEGSIDPPFGWPSQGCLKFSQVALKYRDNLEPALKNINFSSEAFERIAVVGRTGAGKTSMMAALLRVAPLLKGQISLDCVDLKSISLKVLRERIGIIPQDPFLFEGTVRENLDPRQCYYDTEIWHSITNCPAVTPLVQSLGGLDGRLEKGGINLSAGQRQLFCLARALLKSCKVVCIDEGTSNMDDESELAMQQALRNSFKSSTVLYIAHRLKGLQSMDRIIVLDHGEIIEQGRPRDLTLDTTSQFYSMLQAQHINSEEFLMTRK